MGKGVLGMNEPDGQTGISRSKSIDTGMVFTLVCLLAGQWNGNRHFISAAILLLFFNIIYPSVFKLPARAWFGLSSLLGAFTSKIILTLIFYVLITPIGLVRKLLGTDLLLKGQWKKNRCSVFRVVEETYEPRHIEKPY